MRPFSEISSNLQAAFNAAMSNAGYDGRIALSENAAHDEFNITANDTDIDFVITASTNVRLSNGVYSSSVVDTAVIFSETGQIFSDENWTRAQFFAREPTVSDSVLTGQYGVLDVAQDGRWTYTVDNGNLDVQALAAGKSLMESFAVNASDQSGGVDTRTIDATIVGTNDAPTVEPLGVPDPQPLQYSGGSGPVNFSNNISFSDVDVSDQHTVQFAFNADASGLSLSTGAIDPVASQVGTFSVTPISDTTGGSGGLVNWNYQFDLSNLSFLPDGGELREVFDVTIDDGHGGQVVRQITVLIDGQNPVPRMSVVATDGADLRLSTVYDTIANSPIQAGGTGYQYVAVDTGAFNGNTRDIKVLVNGENFVYADNPTNSIPTSGTIHSFTVLDGQNNTLAVISGLAIAVDGPTGFAHALQDVILRAAHRLPIRASSMRSSRTCNGFLSATKVMTSSPAAIRRITSMGWALTTSSSVTAVATNSTAGRDSISRSTRRRRQGSPQIS